MPESYEEKVYNYYIKMIEDIGNSIYKPNAEPQKESIIQTILNSKIDYIPVNKSLSCQDLFVLNKHEILYILSEKKWRYEFLTISGWGFDTPVLCIESEDPIYKDCTYLEIYLPKDELLKCGREELAEIGYTGVITGI